MGKDKGKKDKDKKRVTLPDVRPRKESQRIQESVDVAAATSSDRKLARLQTSSQDGLKSSDNLADVSTMLQDVKGGSVTLDARLVQKSQHAQLSGDHGDAIALADKSDK